MRWRWVLFAAVGVLVVALIIAALPRTYFPKVTMEVTPDKSVPAKFPDSSLPGSTAGAVQPIGQRILQGYADASQTAEQDVTQIARVLENFALLVKGENPVPLGANEEIAAALRGRNRTQFRMLPDDHPAFNGQGQIVDRWGAPLFFHANARDRIEIRSAGPDRTMWTSDDIHRRADGRFVKGDALLAPSLYEATRPAR